MQNNLTLFFGEEDFLIEETIRKLKQNKAGFSIENLEGKISWEILTSLVTQGDLFSTSRKIFFKNPWFLSDAVSESDIKTFEGVIKTILSSPHDLILYTIQKSVDQRKKAFQLIKKLGTFTEFKSFKDWEQDKILLWIKSRVTALGKKIDQDALIALEEIGGTNLRVLAGEIEKLLTFCVEKSTITLSDIKLLNSGESVTVFDLSEAMKRRNISEMVKISSALIDQGEEPLRLSGLLISNLRLYTQILAMLAQKKTVQDVATALGKNPYFLQKLIPDLKKNYTFPRLQKAFQLFSDFDLGVKSGKVSQESGLLLTLSNLYTTT